ncbi:Broad specificity phosphatase PhoE [Bowdeniella nasicola]|uniref:phosphoglycerate mutase (2,3-diphosphoglycerate-dependent) n=1 Tax=Bowdeniella nasicola TaxID=208480 RepID=A0A1H4AMC4_9ACTO|nr:histidine phosphatase family protein [Bowdeniella nasicola]SEA37126.1 Broad specificity phosphatase PhoE [Bowdeniella nasicola]
MGVSEIVLVRHGQSLGNVAAEAAYRDKAERIDVPARDPDVDLSDTGVEQAQALGAWLASLPTDQQPDAVWSSPYVRAKRTAQEALATAKLDLPLRIDERLRDRDMGITDALTAAGIRAKYPDEAARREWLDKFYYRPLGGESWADMVLRIRSLLNDVEKVQDHQRLLISAHDVVILLFVYVAEDMTEETILEKGRTDGVRNATVTRIVRDEERFSRWRVVDYNLDTHLTDAGVTVTDQPGASDEVGADA